MPPSQNDNAPQDLNAMRLERALRDYLNISTSAPRYASWREYERAEDEAWEKLQAARRVSAGV